MLRRQATDTIEMYGSRCMCGTRKRNAAPTSASKKQFVPEKSVFMRVEVWESHLPEARDAEDLGSFPRHSEHAHDGSVRVFFPYYLIFAG